MPLRFRDRRPSGDAAAPEQAAEPVMVQDDPPPIREASYLNQPAQSQIVPLPESEQWAHAIRQLESILAGWQLPLTLAPRWLTPARDVLQEADAVELYVELDPSVCLITIELWDDRGERLYGVDDYLAAACA